MNKTSEVGNCYNWHFFAMVFKLDTNITSIGNGKLPPRVYCLINYEALLFQFKNIAIYSPSTDWNISVQMAV